MNTVFIDGQVGTTGLMILDRLKTRDDIELLQIPKDKRKDIKTKEKYLNDADLVILCLPDDAAVESVALINNPATRVVDASTAHRTRDGWVYGLPELAPGQRELIKASKRVSNPGCYPTGFVLALYPLIAGGIVPPDYPVTVHAVSGYSGGGNKLIDAYESCELAEPESMVYRPYALNLKQKHVPEMQKWTGLRHPPLFSPAVGNFYKGMLVSIPLLPRLLSRKVTLKSVHEILERYYESEPFVQIIPFDNAPYLINGFLSATACNDTNCVELFVFGNEEQIMVTARLDNLGKGSSGAAVQNMNIMLGLDETTGLL